MRDFMDTLRASGIQSGGPRLLARLIVNNLLPD
jgi:uncharacterized protein YaiI (UPF0178 family)